VLPHLGGVFYATLILSSPVITEGELGCCWSPLTTLGCTLRTISHGQERWLEL
jgi:hypothetical protein